MSAATTTTLTLVRTLMVSSLMMIPSCYAFTLTPLSPLVHHQRTHVPQQHQHQHQQPLYSNKHSSTSLYTSSQFSSELQPGIDIINKHNPSLHESLTNLRTIPYFRYYSVDMLASCEYLPQELFECYTETCEIYPVDEYADDDDDDDPQPIIPTTIRTQDIQEFNFDIDGWARWDMPSEDYYDIIEFQEEFTSYDGSEIWNFIHSRIAFETDDEDELNDLVDSWKLDFNKAVSGMHSMISAHIVQGIQTKITNEEEFADDCEWTNVMDEYKRRLSVDGETPAAIENMYFTFMLLLSAVHTSREYLFSTNTFGCDVNDKECDIRVSQALEKILSSPLFHDNGIDDDSINKHIGVASSNLHDHAIQDEQSKHNLWEARMRSRELLRIMNCVQCNKCRLHGKIAAMGLSTALQLLLGKSGNGIDIDDATQPQIHRVELAALMTTLAKFSNAIQFCSEMEEQIANGGGSSSSGSNSGGSSSSDDDDDDDDDSSGNLL